MDDREEYCAEEDKRLSEVEANLREHTPNGVD